MPPIGLILGNVDFSELFVVLKSGAKLAGPYATLKDASAAGAVTINYGLFINTVISFLIVAFSVFLLVKAVNTMKRKSESDVPPTPVTKDCPFCFSKIPIQAIRCAHCSSELV
jgi:large conductance mechanosensitive channel